MKSNGYTLMRFKGYTLIELLVVITMSIIIFTVGFASYRSFSRRQDLSGVSKALLSDLRLVQQLALTGQKPTVGTCTKLVGYMFTRVSSVNYKLFANCDNSGTAVSIETKSINLPDSVTLTATTNSTLFKILGDGTNLSSVNTLLLSNSASGNTVQILIGVGGDIN